MSNKKEQKASIETKTEDKACENCQVLVEKLQEAETLRDEYLKTAQLARADFENYRKRNQNIYADAYGDGMINVVMAFLSVLDNLERAYASATADPKTESIAEGVERVIRQFVDALGNLNVKEIEALGKPFDPAFHHAVLLAEPTNGEKTGTVMEVLQKGYMMKDKVLRPSMVKVVQ